MSSKLLKWSRIAVALAVFALLTAAFVDFRGLVPWQIGHWLSEIQFTPSLVALLTGASLSLACIIFAIVTLLAGRIYCSAICPLGILQDVIGWFTKRLKSRPARYTKPHTWWRQGFLWGTIIAAVLGWGGFALSLVDPYSNFGRITSDVFRPLVTLANNSAVGLAEAIGWHGLFRAEPHWAGAGALHQPIILLILLIVLVVIGGRLYCNTLCPLGTLLGRLAKRAAFRLQIDRSECQKCAKCLPVCKAQCIDLQKSEIDFSRCVACYNCMDVCEQQSINYRFVWARKVPAPIPAPDSIPNPQRRAFISKTVAGIAGATGISRLLFAQEQHGRHGGTRNHSPAICPPGAVSIDRFLDRCTACHLCITECPTGVLQPAFMEYGLVGIMKPRMDFNTAFCNFDCRRCGEVCPDGAIDLLDLATKHIAKIGEARLFLDQCVVVTNGTDCAACSEQCPTKAVTTVPYHDNLRLPSLDDDLCIGCGACENVCPARPNRAIVVTGLQRHGWAKKKVEPKATSPAPKGDFPF